MKKAKFSFLFLLIALTGLAQNNATIDTTDIAAPKKIAFNYKQLIIPSVLIGYGIIGLESDRIKGWNIGIRNEVVEDIDDKLTIDDFTQYAPAVSVYALNNLGVKGKNNLKERSIVLGTSMVFVLTTVTAINYLGAEPTRY